RAATADRCASSRLHNSGLSDRPAMDSTRTTSSRPLGNRARLLNRQRPSPARALFADPRLASAHNGSILAQPCASNAELDLEQRITGLRVRRAAGCLHDLADEPTDHCRLRFGLLDLVRVLGDDFVDDPLDFIEIRNLAHPPLFDDAPRRAALAPDNLEK